MPELRFCALSELRRAKRVTRWVEELRDELTALDAKEGPLVFSSFCPHFGGEFDFDNATEERLTCKWHGWSFDPRSGRCLSYAVRTELRHYAARADEAQDALLVEGGP